MGDWIDELKSTPEGRRDLQRESAILEVTCHVCDVMKSRRVSKTELARRLRKPRSYVTKFLDSDADTPLSAIADVLTALGVELKVGSAALSVAGKAVPHD